MEYSAEKFYALLRWLDPDVDRAAAKYEAIRRRLVQFFALRQSLDPEELADETMQRVAGNISEIVTSYQGEPSHYFYAVAKRIVFENRRKPPVHQVTEDLPVREVEKDDRLYECFDKCMLGLTADKRELLLAYYEESKRAKIEARRQLAAQLGVSPANLRIGLFRLTTTLRECIGNCMKIAAAGII